MDQHCQHCPIEPGSPYLWKEPRPQPTWQAAHLDGWEICDYIPFLFLGPEILTTILRPLPRSLVMKLWGGGGSAMGTGKRAPAVALTSSGVTSSGDFTGFMKTLTSTTFLLFCTFL